MQLNVQRDETLLLLKDLDRHETCVPTYYAAQIICRDNGTNPWGNWTVHRCYSSFLVHIAFLGDKIRCQPHAHENHNAPLAGRRA